MRRFTTLLFIVCFYKPLWAAENWLVVTEDAPPLQYIVDGEVRGKSTEIVRAVIKEAGINARFMVYPWARAFSKAQNRPNTLLYSTIRAPERESQFLWIGEIGRFQMGFVALKGNNAFNITTTEQAKRFVIGVVRDDFTHEYLQGQGFLDKDLVIRSSLLELLDLFYKGLIDSFLIDKQLVCELVEQNGFSCAQMRLAYLIPGLGVEVYLAANKDSNPEELAKLATAYDIIKSNPKYQNGFTGFE